MSKLIALISKMNVALVLAVIALVQDLPPGN
jgi:hypothetical protein